MQLLDKRTYCAKHRLQLHNTDSGRIVSAISETTPTTPLLGLRSTILHQPRGRCVVLHITRRRSWAGRSMDSLLIILTIIVILLIDLHLPSSPFWFMALRRGRRWSLHGRQLARHVVSRWVMCGLRGVIAMGTLLFDASVLRGLTAIRLSSSRRGRPWLLRGRLVLPLAEALGTDRWRPVIMLIAMKCGLRSSGSGRLGRWSSRLHVARAGGILLRIRRLMLRISRLWRGHAVVVHGAQLRPGAVVPVCH